MDVDEPAAEPAEPAAEPKRRGRPPGSRNKTTGGAAPKRQTRFERRADKATGTIRKLVHLRRPDLDIGELAFLEVVERDADAWGRFVAQLAEWVLPFGQLVDLIFGAPLLVLIDLAPSVRAARRDLAAGRQRRQAAREQARLEAEQAAHEDAQVAQVWEVPQS